MKKKPDPNLAFLLEKFFLERLLKQRSASLHTIKSYRDSFRLLLQFAQQRLGKAPSSMEFCEIDAPLISAFLEKLEQDRRHFFLSQEIDNAFLKSFSWNSQNSLDLQRVRGDFQRSIFEE